VLVVVAVYILSYLSLDLRLCDHGASNQLIGTISCHSLYSPPHLLLYCAGWMGHQTVQHTSGPVKPARRWKSAIWSLVGLGLTALIYRCFLQDQQQSGSYGCEMSYMWPTYHQVDWPDNPSAKYSLYLYREQGWDRDDRVSQQNIH
jgi:hypothetical protein